MSNPQLSTSGPDPDCQDLINESDLLGQQYHGAFTRWLAHRRRPAGDTRKLLGLARAYDRALEFLIRCAEGLSNRSERMRRKRHHAAVLRSYLRDDLEYLERAQSEEA